MFNLLPAMETNKPKNINDGFVAMEQSINGIKGNTFDSGLGGQSYLTARGGTIQSQIDSLQDILMMFEIMRDPDVMAMYESTNNRIYQAL